jgi:hypothetical protein
MQMHLLRATGDATSVKFQQPNAEAINNANAEASKQL